MVRQFLTLPTIRRATPLRRTIKCIAFVATAGLVGAMVAQGIRVRRNVLDPWHYVAPIADVGPEKFHELLQSDDFKFIAVVTFLTASPGTVQIYNVPNNWYNGKNKVETIAGGGSGAAANSAAVVAVSGGAGGAYSAQINIILTPGGTAQYSVGAGGAAVDGVSNFGVNGNAGTNTWFNGATFGASSVGATAGAGGIADPSGGGNAAGATGGPASGCIGNVSLRASGGNSGSVSTSANGASGGGGAAGPNGNGQASSNAGTNISTNGGNGDAGLGGGGGAAGTPGAAGGNGNEYGGGFGAGGGGGASIVNFALGTTAGAGGTYGAGGGAAGTFTTNPASTPSGAGSQGLIVVSFTPFAPGASLFLLT